MVGWVCSTVVRLRKLSAAVSDLLGAERDIIEREVGRTCRQSRFETCVLEMHTESWIPGQVTARSQVRS